MWIPTTRIKRSQQADVLQYNWFQFLLGQSGYPVRSEEKIPAALGETRIPIYSEKYPVETEIPDYPSVN